ncbi:MAG: uncharacterized protein JWN37_758 [Candidatus Nomurabacteria bacterium]|nr:uncharacterized protein [Candidatus Nomurabacteria bacterium]
MKDPRENDLENIALSITRAVGSVASVIVHTLLFIGAFVLVFLGVNFDRVLLVLTTIVSLEAIYLSIFIQISVNHQAKALASVEKDVEDIAEGVEEIAEDVEEIQEDVEGIQEDMEDIQENVEEIQENVEDLQEADELLENDSESDFLKKVNS